MPRFPPLTVRQPFDVLDDPLAALSPSTTADSLYSVVAGGAGSPVGQR